MDQVELRKENPYYGLEKSESILNFRKFSTSGELISKMEKYFAVGFSCACRYMLVVYENNCYGTSGRFSASLAGPLFFSHNFC